MFLIFFSSIVDYNIGLALKKEKRIRFKKYLLWTSVLVNLGFLGFFKYYNFFIDSLVDAFTFMGHPLEISSLNIILPVGISFYTFQTLSYSIDVYREKLEPTKDLVAFLAFVSFFPQLVAGPIERATHLLPQFYKKRTFNYDLAVDGLKQILWGFFKKVVIADSCAQFANMIFDNPGDYSGSTLFLGAIFFTFQIYGDFSGYSDIAIGTAKLFGFDLMQNFAFPYFSRDIAEFWRRWHISLSTWFRDYLYIPLGGSKGGVLKKIRNTFVIFIVSGFWHGANWTFIIWGLLNALYFLPLLLLEKNRNNIGMVAEGRLFPSIKEFFNMLLTFILVVLTWIFFRADNLTHAYLYLNKIFSKSILNFPELTKAALLTLILIMFFMVIEWLGRDKKYAIQNVFFSKSKFIRWGFYSFLLFLIGMYMETGEMNFIYFQF